MFYWVLLGFTGVLLGFTNYGLLVFSSTIYWYRISLDRNCNGGFLVLSMLQLAATHQLFWLLNVVAVVVDFVV